MTYENCVAVLGPGCSGTSWVAAILVDLGVNMGWGFRTHRYCNYEDGGLRRCLAHLHRGGRPHVIDAYFDQRAEEAGDGLWGFKNPEIFDHWPTFKPRLQGRGIRTILTMRDWEGVENTMKRQGWEVSRNFVRARWDLANSLVDEMDLVVRFQDLRADEAGVRAKIRAFVEKSS